MNIGKVSSAHTATSDLRAVAGVCLSRRLCYIACCIAAGIALCPSSVSSNWWSEVLHLHPSFGQRDDLYSAPAIVRAQRPAESE